MLEILVNGLWILGLAVILATWSYARFAAYQGGVRTREKLGELTYTLIADLGLLAFIGGMALTEARAWARVLWVALGFVVIGHAVMAVQRSKALESEE